MRPDYQTVWIHIKHDKISGLIGIQTVCKGYHGQQMGVIRASNRCWSKLFAKVISRWMWPERQTVWIKIRPGKGLTSWLSFVVSNCEFVTFPLVSWGRCGTWLYRFLIFTPLLILTICRTGYGFKLLMRPEYQTVWFQIKPNNMSTWSESKLYAKVISRWVWSESNSLDPDQAWQYVGSDLDPNCLQRLSALDTDR